MSDEEVIEIELTYLDTPKGKVATLDSTRKLAQVLNVVQEESRDLDERVKEVESKTLSSALIQNLERRIENIERTQEEILDKVNAVIEAFQDLVELLERLGLGKKERLVEPTG